MQIQLFTMVNNSTLQHQPLILTTQDNPKVRILSANKAVTPKITLVDNQNIINVDFNPGSNLYQYTVEVSFTRNARTLTANAATFTKVGNDTSQFFIRAEVFFDAKQILPPLNDIIHKAFINDTKQDLEKFLNTINDNNLSLAFALYIRRGKQTIIDVLKNDQNAKNIPLDNLSPDMSFAQIATALKKYIEKLTYVSPDI